MYMYAYMYVCIFNINNTATIVYYIASPVTQVFLEVILTG